MRNNTVFTFFEYDSIESGVDKGLPEADFKILWRQVSEGKFVFKQKGQRAFGGAQEQKDVFLCAIKKNKQVIKACNFVGVVSLTSGKTIQILPKIGKNGHADHAIAVFLEMLRLYKDLGIKHFGKTNLATGRYSLLEIFIKMFADEVFSITQRGITSAYNNVESNERFFKGKLLTSENIRKNAFRPDRFYVSYDEFSYNRPENRLIKSTLLLLQKLTKSNENLKNLNHLLGHFYSVNASTNHKVDILRCASDRSVAHYKYALAWCQVFLDGFYFAPAVGKDEALSFLFPMEEVFETYIAKKLQSLARKEKENANVLIQDETYYLCKSPNTFLLRPDIVVEEEGKEEEGKGVVIVDTKWKLPTANSDNKAFKISSEDLYQMYAYGKRYNARAVVLLYPKPKSQVTEEDFITFDSLKIKQMFIDFEMVPGSIEESVDESLRAVLDYIEAA